MEKKLHRSSTDKAIAGVCGGIGEYFGIDSIIVRLVFVLLALGAGSGVVLYIVCVCLMPTEEQLNNKAEDFIYTEPVQTTDQFGNTYTTYQDCAANSRGQARSYAEAVNSDSNKKERNEHKGFGFLLIAVAIAIVIKEILPRLSSSYIVAGLLLIIGAYFVFKKK